jgi:hypothetical protein
MRIVAKYSFNGGLPAAEKKYSHLLKDVVGAIASVKAEEHQTKSSKEKTMPGRMLYSPKALNKAFDAYFFPKGWAKKKVPAIYSAQYYVPAYEPVVTSRRRPQPFREMDFVKEKLGVEVQFGKYSFMVYNVCAKMTIFNKLGFIDTGVEIVPVKGFADQMSTGVSYFEQFVWDLEQRGVADIDIPVLILGIDR